MALSKEVKKQFEIDLLPQIRGNRCLLFVGAGLPHEAGLPDARELSRRLWRELGETEPVPETLSEIADIYLRKRTKAELVQSVIQKLTPPRGEIWKTTSFDLIAHIHHLNRSIITTNWDILIEEAIENTTGMRPVVVSMDIDIGQIPAAEHVVYKIHGTWDRPETFVICTSDYTLRYRELLNPQSLIMTNLKALLMNNIIIYLGYSVGDEYIEDLLRQINYMLISSSGHFMGRSSFLVAPLAGNESLQRHVKGMHIKWIDATARDFLSFVFAETAQFVNRKRELEIIRDEKSRFVELSGNAGSGKTRLLNELFLLYKYEDNWTNTFFVDLKKGNPLELIGEQDSSISTISDLSKRQGLLLILDSLDRAKDETIAVQFLAELAKTLNPEVRSQRIIWATRYSIYDRLPPELKFKTFSYPLTSLVPIYVGKMAKAHTELIAGKFLKEEEYEELAKAIVDITGFGHPGSVVAVLQILEEEKPSPSFSKAYLELKRAEILRRLKGKLRVELFGEENQIAGTEVAKVADLMETTCCVFRRVGPGLLGRLIDEQFIKKADFPDGQSANQALLDIHLVDPRSYPMYIIDSTVRYVFALCLKEENVPRFNQLNSWGCQYFWQIQSASREELQRCYLREWLFHRIVELQSELSKENRYNAIKDQLTSVILESYDDRAAKRLSEEIEKDEELNELLREDLGDQLYAELLQIISNLPRKDGE